MCDRRTRHAAPAIPGCGCVRCEECGVVAFTSSIPKGAAFDRWTEEKCWEVTNSRLHLMQRIASEVKARARGRSLLDVGCSVGCFLKLFERNAWTLSGIDPSAAAIHQAREFVDTAYVGTLEGGSAPSGKFDVISILDAIYYSCSPRRMLARASELLNQSGLLVIELPNYEYSLLRRGSAWPFRSCANLQYDSLHRYMLPTAAVLECAASLGLFLDHVVLLGPPSRQNPALDVLGRGLGKLAATVAGKSQGLVDIAPRIALFFRRAVFSRPPGASPDHRTHIDVRSAESGDLVHIACIRRQAFPEGIAASLPVVLERKSLGIETAVARSAGSIAGFVEVWPRGMSLAGAAYLAGERLLSCATRFLTSGAGVR